MFDTSIPRWSSLNRKRSGWNRTPATGGEIHVARFSNLDDTSDHVLWAQISSPEFISDPAHFLCLRILILRYHYDPGQFNSTDLPWVEGSPPCSCPGTSSPSSSQQSRCPCRTWRWIFFSNMVFLLFSAIFCTHQSSVSQLQFIEQTPWQPSHSLT